MAWGDDSGDGPPPDAKELQKLVDDLRVLRHELHDQLDSALKVANAITEIIIRLIRALK